MALTLSSTYAQKGSAFFAYVDGGPATLVGNPGGRYMLSSRLLTCDEPRAGDVVTLNDGTSSYAFAINLRGQLSIVTGPPAAVAGVPYDYTPIVEGVASRYSFVANLQPGLTINPASGRVSGTPTATGAVGLAVLDTTAVAGASPTPTPTPTPSAFLASAQRVLTAYNAAKPVPVASSPPTITIYNGNSVINGRTIAQGGAVATTAVPSGDNPPGLVPGYQWIVSGSGSAVDAGTGAGPNNAPRVNPGNYAPGASAVFLLENADQFEFKFGTFTGPQNTTGGFGTGALIQFSLNGGVDWQRATDISSTAPLNSFGGSAWLNTNFGSVGSRLIRVSGGPEVVQVYGFNFPAGAVVSAAATPQARLLCFGDSWIFSQGARDPRRGMAQMLGNGLGIYDVHNHGKRTNGFANNQGGVQLYFYERITFSAYPEIGQRGSFDAIYAPPSINDIAMCDSNPTLAKSLMKMGWQAMRNAHPSALIVATMGVAPPEYNITNWLPLSKAAFEEVFGATEAQRTANGAAYVDLSTLVARGARGGNPYMQGWNYNTGQYDDYDHPADSGHAAIADAAKAAFVALATTINGGGTVTPTSSYRISSLGNRRIAAAGSYRKAA